MESTVKINKLFKLQKRLLSYRDRDTISVACPVVTVSSTQTVTGLN